MAAKCPACGGDHLRRECPSADEPLSPGTRLDDKYVVIRHLSTGGMGAVYEVEHAGLGKRLAAKVLLPELAKRPRLLERFRREARAASATGHENIVEVTDLGQTRDRSPFLVMELLTGRTLGQELKAGPLQPERAVHVARQVLSALAAAHEQGIVHRDLKPENIFLIKRGGDPDFVKVLDFGIVKMIDELEEKELTQAGQVVGTPGYMAPEQARGDKQIDGRADLYAVGAMLYRMLTGRRPFAGDNFNQLIFAIAQGNPVPPRQHNQKVSPLLETVVLRAMQIERSKRYQTAEEFDEALAEDARTEERRLAVEPAGPPVETAPGWSVTMHGVRDTGRVRRVLSTMSLVAIAAGLGVVLTGGGWLIHRRVARERTLEALRAEEARREAQHQAAATAKVTSLCELKLELEPAGARVTIDGAAVVASRDTRSVASRDTPSPSAQGSSQSLSAKLSCDGTRHLLRAEADGFAAEETPFFASADQTLVVRLKKKGAKRPRRATPEGEAEVDPQQMKTLEKLINKLGEEVKGL